MTTFSRIEQTSFSLVDFGAFNELPLQDTYELIRDCSGEVFILNIPYIPQGTITFDDKVTLPLAIKKPYFINFRKVKLNITAPFKYSASPFYIIDNSDRITAVTFQKKEFYFDPCNQSQHFRISIITTPATLNELRINPFNAVSFSITPLLVSVMGDSIYSYVVNCNSLYMGLNLLHSREKCLAWNMVEASIDSPSYGIAAERQQFTNSYEQIRIRRFSYRHANAADILHFYIDFFDQVADESKNIHNIVQIDDNVPANTTTTAYLRIPSGSGRSILWNIKASQALQSAFVRLMLSENEILIRAILNAGAVADYSASVAPVALPPLLIVRSVSNAALASNIGWGLSLY